MGINITDVAKKAGVSPATISRALQKPELVKPETREKILAIVKELSYSPNPLARGLMTGKTYVIAMITSNLTNTYYAQLTEGCEEVLRKNNYHLIIANSFGNRETEGHLVNSFVNKMVDGIIMAGVLTPQDLTSILPSNKKKFPVTFINHAPSSTPEYDFVLLDHSTGTTFACQTLIEAGAKNIAVITASPHHWITKTRMKVLNRELSRFNMELTPDYIKAANFGSIYSGYEAMTKLLNLPVLPDGVFAFNDTIATGAIKAILSKGLGIPDDIAVVGFDDIPLAPYLTPSLTTVNSPNFELGKEAANLTLSKIENPYRPSQEVVLPVKLVKRESC